jgi:hypothetical protein
LKPSGLGLRNYEAIDSKQFAQLKKILGIFADDQSTVIGGHLQNINQNAPRLIDAAAAPRTREQCER